MWLHSPDWIHPERRGVEDERSGRARVSQVKGRWKGEASDYRSSIEQ